MRPQTFCGVMPMTALMGCATNPYTHWLQLELMPRAKNRQWGCKPTVRSFTILKCKSDPQQVNAMQRIAARIIDAAKASKCADIAKKFDWQVSAIKDGHTQNAFALRPKNAVYTGIFPVAQNEAGLAAILGHQVAHALAWRRTDESRPRRTRCGPGCELRRRDAGY